MAGCRERGGLAFTPARLPAPLPKLWATGLAENIELLALGQEEGHEYCEAMLGGPGAGRQPAGTIGPCRPGTRCSCACSSPKPWSEGHLSNWRNGIWVGEYGRRCAAKAWKKQWGPSFAGFRPKGRSPELGGPVGAGGGTALKGLVEQRYQGAAGLAPGGLQGSPPGQLVLANPSMGRSSVPWCRCQKADRCTNS